MTDSTLQRYDTTSGTGHTVDPSDAPAKLPAGQLIHFGHRHDDLRHLAIGDLPLDGGGTLPQVTLAYETWGALNADRSNAVLIEHALTADSHAADGGGVEGWWSGLVGPGKPVDTEKYFVVAANMIGGCYGSTGPSSPHPDGATWGSRFPLVTIRDSVRAEAALADELGIERWHDVIGGSMGAMRALEWAVMYPDRVAHCAVIASSPYSSAEQIGWAHTQLVAIRSDPEYLRGDYYDSDSLGPVAGLALARQIAHITYRSEPELGTRFGRDVRDEPAGAAKRPRYEVESYLDHQADKLVDRFDANSYISLTEALISHDVARGRGTLAEALAGVTAELTVIAVQSDRLYPPHLSEELAEAAGARTTGRRTNLYTVGSAHGHDGFLLETPQIGAILREVQAKREA